MSAAPLHDDELDSLFAGLTFKTLVVAVSGGSDSVALLRLLLNWCALREGKGQAFPKIIVATVDHGLRPGSRDEAEWVGRLAASLGVPHHILVWHDRQKTTGLQEAARAARYQLLGTFAATFEDAVVVTAHHLEDQAETVLMRLARGSGLDGLSAMRPQQGRLVRPLLGTSKARLLATLDALGQGYMEDPSNAIDVFERVRLRAGREALDALGLTPQQLGRSAARLQRARDALNELTRRNWSALVTSHDGAFARIDRTGLTAEPLELQIRLMSRALAAWGGSDAAHLLAKAELFIERLHDEPPGKQTLAGCTISDDGHQIIVCREWGRDGLPELELTPGQTSRWDNRFDVGLRADATGPVSVRALGPSGVQILKDRHDTTLAMPYEAALTLPSFWRQGDRLLAVPHLGFIDETPSRSGTDAPHEHFVRFIFAE